MAKGDKRMTIRVLYNKDGQLDPEMDKKIKKAMESIGLRFTGSGMSLVDGDRDMSFSDSED